MAKLTQKELQEIIKKTRLSEISPEPLFNVYFIQITPKYFVVLWESSFDDYSDARFEVEELNHLRFLKGEAILVEDDKYYGFYTDDIGLKRTLKKYGIKFENLEFEKKIFKKKNINK